MNTFDQGNVVLCTFISPFSQDRDYVRGLLPDGRFIEIFVKCNIETCKKRDPKGLYRKAEAGEISDFTGVTSPYEDPIEPEIVIETDIISAEDCVEMVREYLKGVQKEDVFEGLDEETI